MRFKGTVWALVVVIVGMLAAIVSLQIAGKDVAQLVAFATMALGVLVNTVRTDEAAEQSKVAADTTEEVKGQVGGELIRAQSARFAEAQRDIETAGLSAIQIDPVCGSIAGRGLVCRMAPLHLGDSHAGVNDKGRIVFWSRLADDGELREVTP